MWYVCFFFREGRLLESQSLFGSHFCSRPAKQGLFLFFLLSFDDKMMSLLFVCWNIVCQIQRSIGILPVAKSHINFHSFSFRCETLVVAYVSIYEEKGGDAGNKWWYYYQRGGSRTFGRQIVRRQGLLRTWLMEYVKEKEWGGEGENKKRVGKKSSHPNIVILS